MMCREGANASALALRLVLRYASHMMNALFSPHAITIVAVILFPLVAIGSGLLAQRLMGPRAHSVPRLRHR